MREREFACNSSVSFLTYHSQCVFENNDPAAIIIVVQVHLKDLITAVVSRRKAYRLREGHFRYAFGSDVAPQPYLKNSLAAYHAVTE